MKKRLIAIIVAAMTFLGLGVMTASADQQFGCTVSGRSGLHTTVTRINYGNNKSAIYASATQRWVYVRSLAPDITYTFDHFNLTGQPARYSQPTQWGSSTAPLDLSTRTLTAIWRGTTAGTTSSNVSCSVAVGV